MTRRRVISQSWGLGRFIFLITFTVAFSGLGIYQVNRQYDVIKQGYRVDRELFDYRRELETQKRLSLLLSSHRDPTTLRAIALEELGMSLPERERELFVPTVDRAGAGAGLFPSPTPTASATPDGPDAGGAP